MMAHGSCKTCPFDEDLIKEGRELMVESVGAKRGIHVGADIFGVAGEQSFLLNLAGSLGEGARDFGAGHHIHSLPGTRLAVDLCR